MTLPDGISKDEISYELAHLAREIEKIDEVVRGHGEEILAIARSLKSVTERLRKIESVVGPFAPSDEEDTGQGSLDGESHEAPDVP